MYIIGERINGMFKDVRKAIKTKDKSIIHDLAKRQLEAGAQALDINVGPAAANPIDAIKWLVETTQEVVDVRLAIDSPKPEVIRAGLELCKQRPIINSTDGSPKLDVLMPLANEFNASIIGLAMDEKGIPSETDQRVEIGGRILVKAMEVGIASNDVYLDPVLLPVKFSQDQFKATFETIRQFKMLSDPAPQVIVGLSNVSQGCVDRQLVNRVCAVMCITCGLDGAILDPMDKSLMDEIITAELIMNRQIYCDSYIEAYLKSVKNR